MSEYTEKHEGEKDLYLTGQRIKNGLFRDCVIKGLRQTWLVECEMAGSKIAIDNPLDFLDVTLTLNCFTFRDVRLSETIFDAIIYLLSLGSGNDKKRKILREMVDPARLRLFDRVFPRMGTQ